jgi:transcription elongation factor Elf1
MKTECVLMRDIEKVFVSENIPAPIIRFVGYDAKTKEDIYVDEKSGKEVRVGMEKEAIDCPICEKRRKAINALLNEVDSMKPLIRSTMIEHWERNKDDYKRGLRECDVCRGVVSSSMADKDNKTHTHYCKECNMHYPKESGKVYDGTYLDDSFENGGQYWKG